MIRALPSSTVTARASCRATFRGTARKRPTLSRCWVSLGSARTRTRAGPGRFWAKFSSSMFNQFFDLSKKKNQILCSLYRPEGMAKGDRSRIYFGYECLRKHPIGRAPRPSVRQGGHDGDHGHDGGVDRGPRPPVHGQLRRVLVRESVGAEEKKWKKKMNSVPGRGPPCRRVSEDVGDEANLFGHLYRAVA